VLKQGELGQKLEKEQRLGHRQALGGKALTSSGTDRGANLHSDNREPRGVHLLKNGVQLGLKGNLRHDAHLAHVCQARDLRAAEAASSLLLP